MAASAYLFYGWFRRLSAGAMWRKRVEAHIKNQIIDATIARVDDTVRHMIGRFQPNEGVIVLQTASPE